MRSIEEIQHDIEEAYKPIREIEVELNKLQNIVYNPEGQRHIWDKIEELQKELIISHGLLKEAKWKIKLSHPFHSESEISGIYIKTNEEQLKKYCKIYKPEYHDLRTLTSYERINLEEISEEYREQEKFVLIRINFSDGDVTIDFDSLHYLMLFIKEFDLKDNLDSVEFRQQIKSISDKLKTYENTYYGIFS